MKWAVDRIENLKGAGVLPMGKTGGILYAERQNLFV